MTRLFAGWLLPSMPQVERLDLAQLAHFDAVTARPARPTPESPAREHIDVARRRADRDGSMP
jgi:hypothetical protein